MITRSFRKQYVSILGINSVLSRLITESGISESELARQIKIPIATLNKLKTGRVSDPKASTLILIANYFSLTVDQLLGNAPIELKNSSHLCYVPLIDWENLFDIYIENLNYANHKTWVAFENQQYTKLDNIFALKVIGDAMWPYFDENTVIIIGKNIPIINKKCAVVYLAENQEIVLRQIFIDGNSQIAKPINDIFKTVTLGSEDKIIGTIIHSIRSF